MATAMEVEMKNKKLLQNLKGIWLCKSHGQKTGWLSSHGALQELFTKPVSKWKHWKTMHSWAVAFPEDWAGAAGVKHRPFFPHGQCTAPSPELQCPPPLISGRGPGQAGTEVAPDVHLWSCAVGGRPAGHVPGSSGDWHPPHPELPLPMAGIAHQLTCLAGKEQNWMQPWRGWLNAKAGFSLAWRQVCVDITKGSSLPFSHSPAMEFTSVWKTWDCSCCLVIQLKIFYFPLESLKICECGCERLSTGKCDLSKYLSID